MKRIVLHIAILLAVASVGRAGPTCERWGAKDTPCTHPGTLRITRDKGPLWLRFDLSAIPPRVAVYHALLYCFTQEDAQPVQPPRVYEVQRLLAGKPVPSKEPLKLAPPWYRALDVSDVVRRWIASPKRNRGFAVERFEGLLPDRTYLEIMYEGRSGAVPGAAQALRAVHHDGQTFIIWKEHPDFRPDPNEIVWVKRFAERGDELAPGAGTGHAGMPNHPAITLRALRRLQGLALRIKPSGFQGIKALQRIREVPHITYRIYRHDRPINPRNLYDAEPIAEVPPLSGFDPEVYKIHFRGEYLDQWEDPNSVIPTYCVDKGVPLQPGEGLYVHTVRRAAESYYAVTVALAGTENMMDLAAGSLLKPVDEKPATPQPVLQWIQEDRYKKAIPEHWYRYWAAPPYANLPSRSLRLAVAVGDKFAEPGPLTIGTISGAFNVRESIRVPKDDAATILIQRQLDWLPALFYNEGRGTLRGQADAKVDYFCERYMSFLIQWIMGRQTIDRSRISGELLHFGLRHPEIFTRMSFGTYTAAYDVRFAPGGPSMPRVLGPQGIRTAKGEDAWKMYSVAEYVNTYPGRDIPFLLCISGTGKDRGHTSEFGWQDDPRGWRGLLAARQPFVAAWSTHPPRELTQAFEKMRWDGTIPAFSNGSLDDNPGNGDPADGDYYGCINGWLLWDDRKQTDEKDAWETTVWLVASCPENTCTVDVTPRHCKSFKPKPGETFTWTNTSVAGGKRVARGTVKADKWGLVTVPAAAVTKTRNRIRIQRK